MAYLKKPKAKAKAGKSGRATPDERLAKRWCEEIERYERGTQKWRERAQKIEKIYLDEHRNAEGADRGFAILWANMEVMKPATFARRPQAVVSRLWQKDDIGRRASEVLERSIQTTFNRGIDEVMEGVRDDRLLAARGTAWVRFECDFEDIEGAQPDAKGVMPQRKCNERVINEFVHWSDFGHTLARTWPEVNGVWRAVYMTRDKVKKRGFANEEAVKSLTYDVRPELSDRATADADATEPQAKIYEIWDKENDQTIWLNKAAGVVLEAGEPPLDLPNFFPCPKPAYGTKSSRSLVPVPDYRYYQDQAEEINDLTAKISALTGWLRLKGFIPAGASSEGGDALRQVIELEQAMRSKGEEILVPVESWAGFTDKGGSKELIQWIPLDVIVTALREAVATRRELKNDVFELTGISDILRGESDPNETLGAQQLKAQTGSRRISTIQRDLARFAKDLAELNGDVIAELFSPETLSEMSGYDLTVEVPPELLAQKALLERQLAGMGHNGGPPLEDPAAAPGAPGAAPAQPNPEMQQQLQQIEQQLEAIEFNKQVLQLLRDEKSRGFRIDIETDSTIEPDEQAEKQRRTEFLAAVGSFMQQALPVAQASPSLLPVMKEMLLFLVRGFRAGRSLEDVLEKSLGELEQAAHQEHPDPATVKAKAELALKEQTHAQTLAAQQQQHQQQLAADQQRHQQTLEAEAQRHAETLEAAEQQHQQKMQQAETHFTRQQHAAESARHDQRVAANDERTAATASDAASGQVAEEMQSLGQQIAQAGHALAQLMQMVEAIKAEVTAPAAAPA
jgi:hypothetical protein